MLYEELNGRLSGADRIEVGRWYPFAFEVSGRVCHFFVGDLVTPRATFALFEGDAGAAGLKPRVVGGPVWVDNVRVTSIDALRVYASGASSRDGSRLARSSRHATLRP